MLSRHCELVLWPGHTWKPSSLSLADPPEAVVPQVTTNNGCEKGKLEDTLRYIQSQRYDVFLSFAQEDEEFAEEVKQRLVTQASLRVFVPNDGQL